MFCCSKWSISWLIVLLGVSPSLGEQPAEKSADRPALTDTSTKNFAQPKQAQGEFDRTVVPLLIRRCLECHSGSECKGELNLSTRVAAYKGGESGPAIIPGNVDQSLLWERIAADEMPPENPLSAKEKAIVKRWIETGAAWGTDPIDLFLITTEARAGFDWWSLQPINRPTPPVVKDEQWTKAPLDRFVLAKLEQRGLKPSALADRRTLIRRLSFDLLGLPPTPGEVEAFQHDTSADAYERLVDRYLSSPRYGERWARHWLDVARFGESQGFERDKLRPNAWRYRDWVVDALNADLPYDEFSRRQLAGDVLLPGVSSAIVATGFLVAGTYDEVGQSQQSDAMKAVVRQDELEDIVSVVGQTFLGLTINCSRCHDHKFDPIRQQEYYRLTSALGGVRHGERELGTGDRERERQDRIAAFQSQLDGLNRKLASLEADARRDILTERNARQPDRPTPQAPTPIAHWDFGSDLNDSIGTMHGQSDGRAHVKDDRLHVDGRTGYVSTAPLAMDVTEKTLEAWVSLPNLDQRGGGIISLQTLDGITFDAIVFAEREPKRWMAGSNGFVRTQSFGGPEEGESDSRLIHMAVVYAADGTITAYRNGRRYGEPYKSSGPVTYQAGNANVLFGLRHSPAGGNRLLAGSIDRAKLYNRALSPTEIAASADVPNNYIEEKEIVARLDSQQREQRDRLRFEIAHLESLKQRAVVTKTYATVPRQPEPAHVLLRGSTTQKGEIVSAGAVAAIAGLDADFGLSPDAPEAERRVRLARWITSSKNPLFARVIVNRLWHHHFGAGIVDTPSDLGFNGGRPSHPQLLDWLAAELLRYDFSLKAIQRQIVMSATYRQSSVYRDAAAAVDADNRLLWRKSPVRLEAEAVRDAVLTAAGLLNSNMGGPGFQDFTTFVRNTQFYDVLDPLGRSFNRRSLYRTWVRSGRSRFLDAFDCPDPSTKSPKRAVTTTPLQALTLMNNSFVLRMADRLAERLARQAGADIEPQIVLAYELAYGRQPEAHELKLTRSFVEEHGLAALCRVILNSSEFLYVD